MIEIINEAINVEVQGWCLNITPEMSAQNCRTTVYMCKHYFLSRYGRM